MTNMNRIAYAPSMANGDLSKVQAKELKRLLCFVDHISCRETYEVDILKKYTSKDVTQVLDPVMLLNDEAYYKICADRLCEEPYLLIYLPVDNNEKMKTYAKDYAAKHGLKIIEISTKLEHYIDGEYRCIGDCGIEEFLSAIRYATMVFTNSFHAICFSIIFRTQFYAFSRSYAGKVQDICELFGLENHFFADDNFVDNGEIDYLEIYPNYMSMKSCSIEWIKQALGMLDN